MLSRNDILQQRCLVVDSEVKVKHPFPHLGQEDHMSLSASILLGDLHFEGNISFAKCTEQWTNSFPDLKVDRTVFNLNDHIVVELSVKWLEVVVRGLCPVDGQVLIVERIAVNKSSVKEHSIVWFQSSG